MIADSAGGAWSFGGSILTFAFPMILFIVVAGALYVAYTKTELVPGRRIPASAHPMTYTAVPGEPAAAPVPGETAAAPVPGETATGDGETAADGGAKANPEGGE